jgi:hypothetical protein
VLTGVSEGRMADVVSQRSRLDKVLVEPEVRGDRQSELHDLDTMG